MSKKKPLVSLSGFFDPVFNLLEDIFSRCIAPPETFGRTGVCDAVTINKANILILKYVSKQPLTIYRISSLFLIVRFDRRNRRLDDIALLILVVDKVIIVAGHQRQRPLSVRLEHHVRIVGLRPERVVDAVRILESVRPIDNNLVLQMQTGQVDEDALRIMSTKIGRASCRERV